MAGVQMYDYQSMALTHMKNGCILNGGVGSGKSRTSIAYYYIQHGGKVNTKEYVKMIKPSDLYIITTARKRDTLEWEEELVNFYISTDETKTIYNHKVVIDSWNNIAKYSKVKNAFFIFDEQRVVGSGAWSKAFIEISKNNKWILLSATPGDTWMDYIPVFIANGFYRNKTDFIAQHVVFSRYSKYPKVDHYVNIPKLLRFKNYILVDMEDQRSTIRHKHYIYNNYDKEQYDQITKNRWNPITGEPITNAAEYCLCLRKVVNLNTSRLYCLNDILVSHPKAIVFYSFNDELDMLKDFLNNHGIMYKEWNGHRHEALPNGEKWVYLVQYTAGNEGWNCIETDTIIFYSLNYSYKVMEQASGRIDRINTPYKDLHYYYLMSNAKIDKMILLALEHKKKFNEKSFAPDFSD